MFKKLLNISIIVLLLLSAYFFWEAYQPIAPKVDNQTQTIITIYHHFTVYQTRIDNVLYVVEIDTDNTVGYNCDAIITDDTLLLDIGQTCQIVGNEDIQGILSAYQLTDVYPHTKGE